MSHQILRNDSGEDCGLPQLNEIPKASPKKRVSMIRYARRIGTPQSQTPTKLKKSHSSLRKKRRRMARVLSVSKDQIPDINAEPVQGKDHSVLVSTPSSTDCLWPEQASLPYSAAPAKNPTPTGVPATSSKSKELGDELLPDSERDLFAGQINRRHSGEGEVGDEDKIRSSDTSSYNQVRPNTSVEREKKEGVELLGGTPALDVKSIKTKKTNQPEAHDIATKKVKLDEVHNCSNSGVENKPLPPVIQQISRLEGIQARDLDSRQTSLKAAGSGRVLKADNVKLDVESYHLITKSSVIEIKPDHSSSELDGNHKVDQLEGSTVQDILRYDVEKSRQSKVRELFLTKAKVHGNTNIIRYKTSSIDIPSSPSIFGRRENNQVVSLERTSGLAVQRLSTVEHPEQTEIAARSSTGDQNSSRRSYEDPRYEGGLNYGYSEHFISLEAKRLEGRNNMEGGRLGIKQILLEPERDTCHRSSPYTKLTPVKETVPLQEEALGVQINWGERNRQKVEQQDGIARFDVASNRSKKAFDSEAYKRTNYKTIGQFASEEENTNFNSEPFRIDVGRSPLRYNHVEMKDTAILEDDQKEIITQPSGEQHLIKYEGNKRSELEIRAHPHVITVDEVESSNVSISDDDSINIILAKDSDCESDSCELPMKSTVATTAMVGGSMLYFLLSLNKT